MKVIIFSLILAFILSSCSITNNLDDMPQNSNEIISQSEAIKDSEVEQEIITTNKYLPEEFGFVLYEYPKVSIPHEQIKEIVVSFSANFILTKSGEVFSWGLNEDGVLGLGLPTNAMVLTPTKVNFEEPIEKLVVSPGGNSILAVGKNNSIFCWGCNTLSQFPKIDNIFLSTPTKLDMDIEVNHISVSTSCITLSDFEGNIYRCGSVENSDNYYYEVVENGELPSVNTLVGPLGKIDNIYQISSSNTCSVFLTENGDVYILGSLSENDTFETYRTPKLIPFPEKVIKIAAISDGIVALSQDGILYFIGKDTFGIEDIRIDASDEIYYSLDINILTEPTPITKLSEKIIDFSTSSSSILVRTDNNLFYTWGYNIGHVDAETDDNTIFKPTLLNIPNNTSYFYMGNFSGVAMTDTLEIYAWGSGYYGLNMINTYIKSHTPMELLFNN